MIPLTYYTPSITKKTLFVFGGSNDETALRYLVTGKLYATLSTSHVLKEKPATNSRYHKRSVLYKRAHPHGECHPRDRQRAPPVNLSLFCSAS